MATKIEKLRKKTDKTNKRILNLLSQRLKIANQKKKIETLIKFFGAKPIKISVKEHDQKVAFAFHLVFYRDRLSIFNKVSQFKSQNAFSD